MKGELQTGQTIVEQKTGVLAYVQDCKINFESEIKTFMPSYI